MTKIPWTEKVQAISGIVGIIVSIAGFIFLIIQLNQIDRSIRSQNHATIYQTSLELNKLLLDNKEYLPYLLENKPVSPDSANFSELLLGAEIAVDFYEYVYTERKNMHPEMRRTWITFIRRVYANSELIRLYINLNEELLNSEFVQAIKAGNGRKKGM